VDRNVLCLLLSSLLLSQIKSFASNFWLVIFDVLFQLVQGGEIDFADGNWRLVVGGFVQLELLVGEPPQSHFHFPPRVDANAQVPLQLSLRGTIFETHLALVGDVLCSRVSPETGKLRFLGIGLLKKCMKSIQNWFIPLDIS
jgi:hypothetical protein